MFFRHVELREIRMELLHPFRTSFGITRARRILLVKISDGDYEGYGEVTAGEGPFYCHETMDTASYILSEFVIPRLLGRRVQGPSDISRIAADVRGHHMAKGGLEAAAWDLEARREGKPLWQFIGGTRRSIDCGVSIGIQPTIEDLCAKIQTELQAGYQRIKIKIERGWDVDVVRAVREAFPKIRLMVDANSAYTLDDVETFRKMDRYDVMMIEQPLHYNDIIDHATLQKQIQTPLCLDESIHSADDARKAIGIGACRIINIKLGRVGGFGEARAIHDICRDHGIPVWCGGMLESGIGRAHNIALSSLENFSLPGDVSASQRYWARDVVTPPIEVSPSGQITQSDEPGFGYAIDREWLERVTANVQIFSA